MTLSRAVRLAVNAADVAAASPAPPTSLPPAHESAHTPPATAPFRRADQPSSARNGYAGSPALVGMGRHFELLIRCRGPIDVRTGYFMDIKRIDDAARRGALPILAHACARDRDPAAVVRELFAALNPVLGGALTELRLALSPFFSVAMESAFMSPSAPPRAVLRQRFEIAAAHRLHVDALSAADNRALFGRCNNASGHGHNYIIEPEVEVALDAPHAFALSDLERLVHTHIIDPFDHAHLNLDTAEFNTARGGVNPSVENIARVFFERLAPGIAGAGAVLRRITVFETEKTSATYPA